METRILIEEDRDKIDLLRAKAQRNVAKLNQAHAVAPFKTFDELKRLVEGHPQYVRDEMRKDKLTRELLDRGIKVDVPYQLIERGRALTDALECFEFTKYNGNGFEIDQENLHHAEERHRQYVTTDFQARTWKYQNQLIEVLNSFPLPQFARRRNYAPPGNDFIKWNEREQRWERNVWALYHENDFKF